MDLQAAFEELVRALSPWFERELGIQLHNVRHGPLTVTQGTHYGEHAGKQLTISVDGDGQPVLSGELAELVDPEAALIAYRAAVAQRAAIEQAQVDTPAPKPRRARSGATKAEDN